ncbi:hypothetical protein ABXV18_27170 [Vibrio owensii]|uniref:hypothetical protein n=1 Tax=Vibrio owensii TaxID=696485 RepID=UPI00339821AE
MELPIITNDRKPSYYKSDSVLRMNGFKVSKYDLKAVAILEYKKKGTNQLRTTELYDVREIKLTGTESLKTLKSLARWLGRSGDELKEYENFLKERGVLIHALSKCGTMEELREVSDGFFGG